MIQIERNCQDKKNEVESFWNEVTVPAPDFPDVASSLQNLDDRCRFYPFFREYMKLWQVDPADGLILDYGCGPGNDLIGYLHFSTARQVIGMDVSAKALQKAKVRLELHQVDPGRIRLIQIDDQIPVIPLENSMMDLIHCEGVIQHTSHPEKILSEFHRILKPSGECRIMVYNRNSIWYHLYVAYRLRFLEGRFTDLSTEEAFHMTTDGESCPYARCYHPSEFMGICADAGFDSEFIGGYHTMEELSDLRRLILQAQDDERLETEHRDFLKDVVINSRGYPLYQGKDAGLGAVYILKKR